MAAKKNFFIKPWLLSPLAAPLVLDDAAAVIAKPTRNVYLGKPVRGDGGNKLDAVSAGIANLASHGEMALERILLPPAHECIVPAEALRLIDLLPSSVVVEGAGEQEKRIGAKRGKFLYHFGFRKNVLHLMPETLLDHAWIACALSYSETGAWGVAGGVAALSSKSGSVFRGSGVSDFASLLISPQASLEVSLLANGHASQEIDDMAWICTPEEFENHRFFPHFTTKETRKNI
jgi:hypothetical protein